MGESFNCWNCICTQTELLLHNEEVINAEYCRVEFQRHNRNLYIARPGSKNWLGVTSAQEFIFLIFLLQYVGAYIKLILHVVAV